MVETEVSPILRFVRLHVQLHNCAFCDVSILDKPCEVHGLPGRANLQHTTVVVRYQVSAKVPPLRVHSHTRKGHDVARSHNDVTCRDGSGNFTIHDGGLDTPTKRIRDRLDTGIDFPCIVLIAHEEGHLIPYLSGNTRHQVLFER